jgi:hypothetical protein
MMRTEQPAMRCSINRSGLAPANDERVDARGTRGANDERVDARRSPGAKAAGLVGRSPLKGLGGWSMRRGHCRRATSARACSCREIPDHPLAQRRPLPYAYLAVTPCSDRSIFLHLRPPSPFSGLRPTSPAALAPGERRAATRSSSATHIPRTPTRSSFAPRVPRASTRSSSAPSFSRCITTVTLCRPVLEDPSRAN